MAGWAAGSSRAFPAMTATSGAAPGSAESHACVRAESLARAVFGVSSARIRVGPQVEAPAAAGFLHVAPLICPDGQFVGTLELRDPAGRAPLSAAEQAVLADLAATTAAALRLAEDIEVHRQQADHAALQDRLLRAVADAPSFALAVETAMAILRDATQCMLCLFFRLAPDGQRMQLIAGQASTPALTRAYLDWVRTIPVRIDNSLVGLAASTGQQQVVSHIDSAVVARYPAIGLSVAQRITANVVTPISLGEERYAFGVGYGDPPADLQGTAAKLLGIAGALRPLLRRLRDSEEIALFQRVLEASHDPVAISVVHGDVPVICSVNAAFTAQTGYSPAEALGAPYSLLRAPTADPALDAALQRAIAAGRPIRIDLLNRRRDGSTYWADCRMAPLHSDTGAPTHWVAIERDITGRKQAAEAVARSEERLRWVARATGEVVWDWDLVANTIWWGDGMAEQFGHDAADNVRDVAWWEAHLADAERDRVVASRRAASRQGSTQWREEYGFRRADGGLARVSDRGFVICDAAGQPVRMLGSMVDVTQQRRLEEQLRQSQRLDALGRLTGGVAHDFNNLLAVIMGNAELLADALGGEDAAPEELSLILAATERGAAMTRRLLAFARQQPLAATVTDVNHLLRNTRDLIRSLIGSGIALHFTPAETPACVVVDGPQLENAVINLAINARDAMPDGGTLRIEVGCVVLDAPPPATPQLAPGPYVTVTVRDTGAGMTPEVASRAFEPFFTTKSFDKGSGLGLSMVFGFVSQSEGHVEIRSGAGAGTVVTLYLPHVPAPD